MSKSILKLGVNVDHVATVRQARGVDYPSPMAAAQLCEKAGAHGITIHLREDRRHIQDSDLFELRRGLKVPLNLEMANSREIIEIALKAQPDEVCLVPEKRRELTTEGGLDVAGRLSAIKTTVAKLTAAGIRVSLFIDPDAKQIRAAVAAGAPVIELHTGTYCDARGQRRGAELKKLIRGAILANQLGLQVNAGHGINLDNIDGIMRMPHLDTLNIGHSIVARAVLIGMQAAVREMRRAMRRYHPDGIAHEA
ncbi:MAG: pyridoxine 5'-phosphate synthase [Kiritimatiellia bacterium]|jgi:pyridoxine 5-phosphate synthase